MRARRMRSAVLTPADLSLVAMPVTAYNNGPPEYSAVAWRDSAAVRAHAVQLAARAGLSSSVGSGRAWREYDALLRGIAAKPETGSAGLFTSTPVFLAFTWTG